MKKTALLALNIVLCASVYCANITNSNPKITNTISLGANLNTGNSPTREFTGEYKRENELSFPNDAIGYDFVIGGEWATAQSVQTEKNMHTSLEGRYLYSEKNYLFAKTNYIYDAFSTYDITANGMIGIGWQIFKNPQQKLTAEVGPGATYQRIAGSEDKKESILAHGDLNYRYNFSETATFTQSASIDASSFNTHYQAVSAITTKVMKDIALKISFKVDQDSNIPEGSSNTKKTDTATTATILYNF